MGLIYGIFRNLVYNAISYAQSATYLSISGHREDKVVHFLVSDNGAGVHPENLSLIFERFSARTRAVAANSEAQASASPL